MLDTTRLPLFLSAALLLAIAPGPGMLYVLARSLAGGRREGILSALGTLVGGMTHVLAAAAGVSDPRALGGSFCHREVCGRGVPGIFRRSHDPRCSARCGLDGHKPVTSARNPFWQGIATEVLNPKTALFFLSFIPQFVNRESGPRLLAVRNPRVDFGGLEYVRGFSWLPSSQDRLASAFAPRRNFAARQRTATGAVMIGLGTYLALSKSE